MKKYLFSCFVICLLSFSTLAQVGINTTNPHASSALDIQSKKGGLLIPRIDSAARVGMTGMANSLLVYDTIKEMYFYYQKTDAKWYALNAWQSLLVESGGNTDTITTTFSNVGIGTKNPAKRLDVVGDVQVSKTITAGTSVSAPKIYGEGAMPVGAIIMWSGNPNTLPVGWALCDGDPSNAHGGPSVIPDLKGRFIVGYDPADPDYAAPKNVGPVFTDADGNFNGTSTQEAKQVRLTGDQSGVAVHTHGVTDPKHAHNFGYDAPPNDDDLAGGKKSSVSHNITKVGVTQPAATGISIKDADVANANQPIENRPPYYVLAYIIKLTY